MHATATMSTVTQQRMADYLQPIVVILMILIAIFLGSRRNFV